MSILPTCILPQYWKRHTLSREEIDTILSYLPTKFVWMVGMVYGIHCPWFLLRSSASSTMGITLSGKALALEMILGKTNTVPRDGGDPVLDIDSIESLEHIPPIPRYYVSPEDFSHVCSGIILDLLPRSLLIPGEPIGTVPFMYQYLSMNWIPVGLEGSSVCCNALIKESDYVYKTDNRGYTHDPKVVAYVGEVYCLTDELILLTTEKSTPS